MAAHTAGRSFVAGIAVAVAAGTDSSGGSGYSDSGCLDTGSGCSGSSGSEYSGRLVGRTARAAERSTWCRCLSATMVKVYGCEEEGTKSRVERKPNNEGGSLSAKFDSGKLHGTVIVQAIHYGRHPLLTDGATFHLSRSQ